MKQISDDDVATNSRDLLDYNASAEGKGLRFE